MPSPFKISLKIQNIGPHSDIYFDNQFNTNKTAIFAQNGKGKSFIGRLFQYLCNDELYKNIIEANRMLSLGKNDGYFEFIVDTKKSTLNFNRDKEVLKSNNNYIFNVFNTIYVNKNIIGRNYGLPDEESLNGYILGESNINLETEKKSLTIKRQDITSTLQAIKSKILRKLSDYGTEFNLSRNSDYKTLSTDIQNLNYPRKVSFKDVSIDIDKLRDNYKRLSTFPTDEEDISWYDSFQSNIQESIIKERLLKNVNQIKINDSALETFMKKEKDFIKKGTEIFENKADECPFCKRNIDDRFTDVLKMYNEFLKSPEKEMISFCESQILILEEELRLISNIFKTLGITKFKFDVMKDKLNYKHDLIISEDIFNDMINEIKKIIEKLKEKKDNVSSSINFDISKYTLSRINLSTEITRIYGLVNGINTEKSKISIQQKSIRNAIIPLIRTELLESKEFEDLYNSKEEADGLEELIKIKDNRENISAKERYIKTLKKCLDFFFRGKYTLSDDGNNIYFKKSDISNDFSSILSDGEKTIVAFCYYMAETHLIVESEEDYNKIFFIIDDPISSLDSNHIYNMCQIIRDLKKYFPKSMVNEKFIILTHNIEFMSILVRNNIISNRLILEDGNIIVTDDKYFRIPYLDHLKDIKEISEGHSKPNHTTANSVRQIIETISKFTNPNKTFENFISENDELKNSSIYSLCQDGSHGNFDMFTMSFLKDEELITISKDLISYIDNSPFKEQLNTL